MRNSLIPTATYLATDLGYLMGGTVIIEGIFNLPGVGNLLFQGIRSHEGADRRRHLDRAHPGVPRHERARRPAARRPRPARPTGADRMTTAALAATVEPVVGGPASATASPPRARRGSGCPRRSLVVRAARSRSFPQLVRRAVRQRRPPGLRPRPERRPARPAGTRSASTCRAATSTRTSSTAPASSIVGRGCSRPCSPAWSRVVVGTIAGMRRRVGRRRARPPHRRVPRVPVPARRRRRAEQRRGAVGAHRVARARPVRLADDGPARAVERPRASGAPSSSSPPGRWGSRRGGSSPATCCRSSISPRARRSPPSPSAASSCPSRR